jgi:hypothetical protein
MGRASVLLVFAAGARGGARSRDTAARDVRLAARAERSARLQGRWCRSTS